MGDVYFFVFCITFCLHVTSGPVYMYVDILMKRYFCMFIFLFASPENTAF